MTHYYRGILRGIVFLVDRKKRCETLSCVGILTLEHRAMKARGDSHLAASSVPRSRSFPPAALHIPHRRILSPLGRVILDAHNCYPYYEWWFDRIDRALSAGTPLAIEQDLLWAKNPRTGKNGVGFESRCAANRAPSRACANIFSNASGHSSRKALLDGNSGDWPLNHC